MGRLRKAAAVTAAAAVGFVGGAIVVNETTSNAAPSAAEVAAELRSTAADMLALAEQLDPPAPTTTTTTPPPPTTVAPPTTQPSTTTTTQPPAGGTNILHGAYRGVSWPGPLEIEDLHVGQGSWSGQRGSIANWRTDIPIKTNIGLWPKQAYPTGSATLARAAAGDFDAEHRANAAAIKARTSKTVYICLGHEANDDSVQPWAFTRTAADGTNYRVAFNRIAAIYEVTLGQQGVMAFCPGLWNITLANLRAWTPSASEIVGIDVYDRGSQSLDPVTRWNQRHKPGMDALAAYAAERGQRTLIGEWGLSAPCPPGGCDNVYFVQRLFDWMRQTRTVADLYHMSDLSSGAAADHNVSRFPKAWAEMQRQYAST